MRVLKLDRSDRGATLVEFAIVLPLLTLMLLGIIDAARLVAANNSVRTVSREAARYGSAVGDNGSGTLQFVDCAGIRSAGLALSSTTDLSPADIVVTYDSGPSTVALATCPVGGPDPDPSVIAHGHRIVVTTSTAFQPITPLVGEFFNGITVSSTDRRSILSP